MRPRHPARLVAVALLALLALPSVAAAHRPYFSDGDHGDLGSAFALRDPLESIVMNHAATCERQDVWLRFDASAGDEVYVQLGVPMVERFDDYRPVIALIGPGLDGEVPIETGGQPGTMLAPLAERTTYTDEYSETTSWVYVETTETIPETGTYYLAAWPEDYRTGKLWIAVGTEERFTQEDFSLFPMWIEQMGAFYEKSTAGDPIEACEPDASIVTSDGGCQAGGSAAGAWAALALAAGLVRRRRRT